jgi:hypothetical protein
MMPPHRISFVDAYAVKVKKTNIDTTCVLAACVYATHPMLVLPPTIEFSTWVKHVGSSSERFISM